MHCTPSVMKWWCPIQAGSEGAMEQEEGRKTASPDILSGRRPSPTQQAAWGMEGWRDGGSFGELSRAVWLLLILRREGGCRQERKMETCQLNRWQSRRMYEGGRDDELTEQKRRKNGKDVSMKREDRSCVHVKQVGQKSTCLKSLFTYPHTNCFIYKRLSNNNKNKVNCHV